MAGSVFQHPDTRDAMGIAEHLVLKREGRMLDEALTNCIYSRLGPVGDAHLVENIADVVAHGLDADEQLVGDLGIAAACGDKS